MVFAHIPGPSAALTHPNPGSSSAISENYYPGKPSERLASRSSREALRNGEMPTTEGNI